MPNYDDTAVKYGWEKKGSTWTHPDKPGVKLYHAKQIYDQLPKEARRPTSINDKAAWDRPPEPKAG